MRTRPGVDADQDRGRIRRDGVNGGSG
jgi:hypothetical protein